MGGAAVHDLFCIVFDATKTPNRVFPSMCMPFSFLMPFSYLCFPIMLPYDASPRRRLARFLPEACPIARQMQWLLGEEGVEGVLEAGVLHGAVVVVLELGTRKQVGVSLDVLGDAEALQPLSRPAASSCCPGPPSVLARSESWAWEVWLRVCLSVLKKLGVVSFSGGAQTPGFQGSRVACAGALGAAGTLWRKGLGSGFANRLTGSCLLCKDGLAGGAGLRVPNWGGRMSGVVGANRRAVGVQSMLSSWYTDLCAGVVKSV